MFRIRRILDASAVANQKVIEQVTNMLRMLFHELDEEEITSLPAKLNNPLKYRFQTRLLVVEDGHKPIKAFALMLHVPDLDFCILDFIATGGSTMGQGVGEALYNRVRQEAKLLHAKGLFFECLPDDPALSPDPVICKQNAKRLAFYERFGARPIMGTLYETPITKQDTDPPYLVIDLLDNDLPPAADMRKMVQALLERKYGKLCPPAYIQNVVASFTTKNIYLRDKRYTKQEEKSSLQKDKDAIIPLFFNKHHKIHHVQERGYVESPVRITIIHDELKKLPFIQVKEKTSFSDRHILDVHDAGFVRFLQDACKKLPKGKSVYPYVFPIRNQSRKPLDTALHAGYYCIDTFTPINANAYKAAREAVDCALSAAEAVLNGSIAAYALVRPPGHHAERKSFGGFCYFANAAIAAHHLSRFGKVAMLDIDYHHGNSQQDIFYKRSDVLTISIHGHPRFAYPYFTGFDNEVGEAAGHGFNCNYPMPENLSPEAHLKQVQKALKKISDFRPAYLVIALGLDTAKADPTGTWKLLANDFEKLGLAIGSEQYPTVIVQEGGYRTQTLGINARRFFKGLHQGLQQEKIIKPNKTEMTKVKTPIKSEPTFRYSVVLSDVKKIENIVHAAGVFSNEEVKVAGELVTEAVTLGTEKSGYHFVLLEDQNKVIGYACYGLIPLTQASMDLYWIVVDPKQQGKGYAKKILGQVEANILNMNGRDLFAETSSLKSYAQARNFYTKLGFTKAAEFNDFYKPGDGKVIFSKRLLDSK